MTPRSLPRLALAGLTLVVGLAVLGACATLEFLTRK